MGTRVNADPEESAGACYTGADNISVEARKNRTILGTALTAAGLANYPTEWCSQSSSCVQPFRLNVRLSWASQGRRQLTPLRAWLVKIRRLRCGSGG